MRRRADDQFPDNGFEAWGGYMKAKVAKLEEQFCDRSDLQKESDLFQGISIFVNGYTNPAADHLKVLMAKHGGTYHTYQRSSDYIIATNLPDTKVKRLTTTRVVRPEWITQSIAAGRVLDYKQYLLYSNHTRTQPQLPFHRLAGSTVAATSAEEQGDNVDLKESKDSPVHSMVQLERLLDSRTNDPNMFPINNLHTNETPRCESTGTISTDYRLNNQADVSSKICKTTETSARTAVDPKFLSEFYSNSRLHHISQLGAAFKQHVNELREKSDFLFSARTELKKIIENIDHPNESPIAASSFNGAKLIMHIDMDCFFVSVGLRRRPELRGACVAVTHAVGGAGPRARPGVDRHAEFTLYRQRKAKTLSKAIGFSEESLLEENVMSARVDGLSDAQDAFSSMSEIASCSYEARQKGVHNGMFMGAALRLCPDLQTIPYDFEGYKEVAYTLYNTIAKYTLDIEAVSCDEMYVDCTELAAALGAPAQRLARALRHEIRLHTGCPCSTGFGGNRLQARLATKRAKPDGQFFLTADILDTFMMDVALEELPGVGRQLLRRLAGASAGKTCGALRSLPLPALQRHLGSAAGRQLYLQCRGDDPKPLNFVTVRKSVSAEVNYGIRFESGAQCDAFLEQLCGEVHERLQRCGAAGRCITLKLMVRAPNAPLDTAKYMGHGYCDTVSRSATLAAATDDRRAITREVLAMCRKLNHDPREMRGVGIQVTKLESSTRPQRSSAMKAFLIKPAQKVDPGNSDERTIEGLPDTVMGLSETDPRIKDENEIPSASGPKEKVADSMLRTPTKKPISNSDSLHSRDRTPVKLVQLRSPPGNKRPNRSPVKTPTKKKSLGLTGRRRGRPPKGSTQNVPSGSSASKEMMSKFLMGDRSRTEPTCAENLDPDILAALPEDIRQEVIQYYQFNPKEHSRPGTPQTATKAEAVKPNSPEKPPVKAPETRESFAGGCGDGALRLPWRQVRRVLRAQLARGAAPPPCDVALVSAHMQNLVLERSIDGLLVLINFLKRNVLQMQDAAWLSVYALILDGVQETMTAVYGKPLLID